MKLDPGDRFAPLASYRHVLVVGPQRAGTTISARIIAHDLGRTFLDERDLPDVIDQAMPLLDRRPDRCVLQCPKWTWACHRLGDAEHAVVLIRRPVAEIVASQDRIGWTEPCQPRELERYGCSEGRIAEVKYATWDRRQAGLLGRHGYQLDYHTLAGHPLWVEAGGRRGWHAKQTAPEAGPGKGPEEGPEEGPG